MPNIGQLTGEAPMPEGRVTVQGTTHRACSSCGGTFPVCAFDRKKKSYECNGRHKDHLRDLYFKAIGELVHVSDLCKKCYRQGYAMLKADRDQYLLLKASLEEMRREQRRKVKRQNTRKKNRKAVSEAEVLDYEAKLVADELEARAKADKKFKRIVKGKRIKGANFSEQDLKELEAEMLKGGK